MKRILSLLVLIMIISCNSIYDQYPNIEINSKLLRTYDTARYYNDTLKTRMFDIQLSVINKSNNSISFWLMSCSREDNFLINNDYIFFWNPGCDNNLPLLFKLEPNEILTWDEPVLKYYHTRYQFTKETKFGLIFIDSTKCRSITDYESIIGDKSKHDIIIWSNSLILE